MKNTKKLRIAILMMVIVLSISIVSMLILSVLLGRKTEKELKVEALVVGTSFTEDQYKSYSVFEIGSTAAFDAVFKKGGIGLAHFGAYFKDKTVKLTADISVTQFVSSFAGLFDGNGHTITLSSNAYYVRYENGKYSYETTGNTGLFCGLLTSSGIIRNIKFANCKMTCPSGDGEKTQAGIIVGWNQGGTVENCIVENCTILSNRYKSNCSVAPLVGRNAGTVKNCIVKGIYKIGGVGANFASNNDGLYAHYFVVTGNQAQYSIYTASVTKFMETSEVATTEVKDPSETGDKALNTGTTNYKNYTEAYTNITDTNIANSLVDTTAPWYKYLKTGDGKYRGYGSSSSVPIYLRAFIIFKTINFVPASTEYGTVDKNQITVPSDYTSHSITDNTITIYEQVITATANANYNFYNWTSSTSDGVTTWTANFSVRTCSIQFQIPSNVILKVNNVVQTATQSFTINCGTTIGYSTSTYSGMSGKYSSVTYTFKDSGNRQKTVTYTIAGTDNYISGASLNSGTAVYDDLTITVTLAERDYGLEFI